MSRNAQRGSVLPQVPDLGGAVPRATQEDIRMGRVPENTLPLEMVSVQGGLSMAVQKLLASLHEIRACWVAWITCRSVNIGRGVVC